MATFAARWVLGTALAELIGIGWGGALGAVLGPRLDGAGPGVRALALVAVLSVGVVEGGALGLIQGRLLGERLPRLRALEWALPTVAFAALGWGAGMASAVLSPDEGAPAPEPPLPMVLGGAALLGAGMGPMLGAAQWLVLRHHARTDLGPGPRHWVLVQVPAWALGMVAIFAGLGLPPDGASDAVRALAAAGGGLAAGLAVGLVTLPIARALRPWLDESVRPAGKRAVVTGASAGIGEAIARALARLGCEVVVVARDEAALERLKASIEKETVGAKVTVVALDLTDPVAIADAVRRLDGVAIDFLVHSAGATSPTRGLTARGEERTLAVDLLGPMRLTRALEPLLAPAARVVVLTGIYQRRGTIDAGDLGFERRPYTAWTANAQAQRGRLLWVAALGKARFAAAVHPGAVLTRALEGAPRWARLLARTLARPAFVRAELGALPALRLLLDPIESLPSGRFWSRFRLEPDAPRPEEAEAWRALEKAAHG
jgi:NAD(P)-dependent dehydrogenase (short-subunit alcohol dehydrogenase family)